MLNRPLSGVGALTDPEVSRCHGRNRRKSTRQDRSEHGTIGTGFSAREMYEGYHSGNRDCSITAYDNHKTCPCSRPIDVLLGDHPFRLSHGLVGSRQCAFGLVGSRQCAFGLVGSRRYGLTFVRSMVMSLLCHLCASRSESGTLRLNKYGTGVFSFLIGAAVLQPPRHSRSPPDGPGHLWPNPSCQQRHSGLSPERHATVHGMENDHSASRGHVGGRVSRPDYEHAIAAAQPQPNFMAAAPVTLPDSCPTA